VPSYGTAWIVGIAMFAKVPAQSMLLRMPSLVCVRVTDASCAITRTRNHARCASADEYRMPILAEVLGARLVGSKQYAAFRTVMAGYILYASLVGVVVAGAAVVPFAKPISYKYGQTACVYATTVECAPLYRSIFLDAHSLHNAFSWFSLVVALNCIYLFLKPALYACLDFRFMFLASLGALCTAFPLALLVARYGFDSAPSAIFVAMYSPHLVLVPFFGWRLVRNIRLMAADVEGPWSAHQRQMANGPNAIPSGRERGFSSAVSTEVEAVNNKL